jgi:hypothetical protein
MGAQPSFFAQAMLSAASRGSLPSAPRASTLARPSALTTAPPQGLAAAFNDRATSAFAASRRGGGSVAESASAQRLGAKHIAASNPGDARTGAAAVAGFSSSRGIAEDADEDSVFGLAANDARAPLRSRSGSRASNTMGGGTHAGVRARTPSEGVVAETRMFSPVDFALPDGAPRNVGAGGDGTEDAHWGAVDGPATFAEGDGGARLLARGRSRHGDEADHTVPGGAAGARVWQHWVSEDMWRPLRVVVPPAAPAAARTATPRAVAGGPATPRVVDASAPLLSHRCHIRVPPMFAIEPSVAADVSLKTGVRIISPFPFDWLAVRPSSASGAGLRSFLSGSSSLLSPLAVSSADPHPVSPAGAAAAAAAAADDEDVFDSRGGAGVAHDTRAAPSPAEEAECPYADAEADGVLRAAFTRACHYFIHPSAPLPPALATRYAALVSRAHNNAAAALAAAASRSSRSNGGSARQGTPAPSRLPAAGMETPALPASALAFAAAVSAQVDTAATGPLADAELAYALARRRDWSEAFTSLYYSLRNGAADVFYLRTAQYTIVFSAVVTRHHSPCSVTAAGAGVDVALGTPASTGSAQRACLEPASPAGCMRGLHHAAPAASVPAPGFVGAAVEQHPLSAAAGGCRPHAPPATSDRDPACSSTASLPPAGMVSKHDGAQAAAPTLTSPLRREIRALWTRSTRGVRMLLTEAGIPFEAPEDPSLIVSEMNSLSPDILEEIRAYNMSAGASHGAGPRLLLHSSSGSASGPNSSGHNSLLLFRGAIAVHGLFDFLLHWIRVSGGVLGIPAHAGAAVPLPASLAPTAYEPGVAAFGAVAIAPKDDVPVLLCRSPFVNATLRSLAVMRNGRMLAPRPTASSAPAIVSLAQSCTPLSLPAAVPGGAGRVSAELVQYTLELAGPVLPSAAAELCALFRRSQCRKLAMARATARGRPAAAPASAGSGSCTAGPLAGAHPVGHHCQGLDSAVKPASSSGGGDCGELETRFVAHFAGDDLSGHANALLSLAMPHPVSSTPSPLGTPTVSLLPQPPRPVVRQVWCHCPREERFEPCSLAGVHSELFTAAPSIMSADASASSRLAVYEIELVCP